MKTVFSLTSDVCLSLLRSEVMTNKLIQCTSAVVFISALYGILALKMLLSDQHKYRWAYIVQEKK